MNEEERTKPGKVFKAVTAIMEEIKAITKAQKNQHQGWNFRGIDDCYNSIQPLLAKHKVFTVPNVLGVERWETKTSSGKIMHCRMAEMEYKFYCEDGSHFIAKVYGEGSDTGDKATNCAMSIAHKYVLLQVFMPPTKDMEDPDRTAQATGSTKTTKRSASKKTSAGAADAKTGSDTDPISEAQHKRLMALLGKSSVSLDDIKAMLKAKYGLESSKDIPWGIYNDICNYVESKPKETK